MLRETNPISETDGKNADAIRRPGAAHRMLARWSWALMAVFVAGFLPLVVWYYFYSGPVRSAGREFASALETANYERAFDLCSPVLQNELGDKNVLRQIVEENRNFYAPAFWTGVTVSGNRAELRSGSENEFVDRRSSATLHLEKVGNAWRVSGFSSSGSDHDTLRIPPR